MWVRRHVRYVVEKRNKDGTSRFYWQRRGFPTRRLRAADLEPGALADKLNKAADQGNTKQPAEYGTIAWAIEAYRHSRTYTKLAQSTRRLYERWMLALMKEIGTWPITDLRPKEVYEIIDGIESKVGKIHCAAVLSKMSKVAIKHGLIVHNPAQALELERARRRDQTWPETAQRAFLKGCEDIPDGVGFRLGFLILKYTAQRPGDMRRMAWSQYDGDCIRLRQQKTGKLLDVPCHSALRAELDAAERISPVIVTRDNGRPFTEAQWIKGFREIMSAASIEGLQARDLRRTAMVELGTLGADIYAIAAVSGHSIERSKRILETYMPRNVKMAERAIRHWEEHS